MGLKVKQAYIWILNTHILHHLGNGQFARCVGGEPKWIGWDVRTSRRDVDQNSFL